MKSFNKEKNWEYLFVLLSSLLVLMMTFQNCQTKNRSNVLPQNSVPPSINPITFKINEAYEDIQSISDILWQVRAHHYNKHHIGCYTGSYHKINFREINSGIELNWDDILQTDNTLGISVFVQAFIQLREKDCITYTKSTFQLVSSNSDNTDMMCVQIAMLPPHINPVSKTTQTPHYIIENLKTPLYHFSVEEPIDFELINLTNIEENSKFMWSIKNMENDIELVDPAHQNTTLTHTFSEKGIYNISATEKDTNFELDTQLVIGKCENINTEDIITRVDSPTASD